MIFSGGKLLIDCELVWVLVEELTGMEKIITSWKKNSRALSYVVRDPEPKLVKGEPGTYDMLFGFLRQRYSASVHLFN